MHMLYSRTKIGGESFWHRVSLSLFLAPNDGSDFGPVFSRMNMAIIKSSPISSTSCTTPQRRRRALGLFHPMVARRMLLTFAMVAVLYQLKTGGNLGEWTQKGSSMIRGAQDLGLASQLNNSITVHKPPNRNITKQVLDYPDDKKQTKSNGISKTLIDTSVIITSSLIPTHPDIKMINETICIPCFA